MTCVISALRISKVWLEGSKYILRTKKKPTPGLVATVWTKRFWIYEISWTLRISPSWKCCCQAFWSGGWTSSDLLVRKMASSRYWRLNRTRACKKCQVNHLMLQQTKFFSTKISCSQVNWRLSKDKLFFIYLTMKLGKLTNSEQHNTTMHQRT